MPFDPFKHHRRSIRLKGFDYSEAGAYFVTICTQNRECFFGEIANASVELSPIGQTAHDFWQEIPRHFPNVELDEFVVMPNHVHEIIVIAGEYVGVEYIQPLRNEYQHVIPQSIGSIVRTYKAAVTRWCNDNRNDHFRWQRNYYEHIIRNERELNAIREYIENNPANWASDMDNLKNIRRSPLPEIINDYLQDVGIL